MNGHIKAYDFFMIESKGFIAGAESWREILCLELVYRSSF